MTADLHYFPISREVADRLGSRGKLAAHPFTDGEPQAKRSGGHPLMEEVRAENERLKRLIGPGEPLPPPRIDVERLFKGRVSARPQLTAEMVSEGKRQRAARLEPCFHIDRVEFGEPFPKLHLLKKISSLFRHLFLPWGFAPLHASETSMSAQPRLHHGNPSPDFPPDPPSGVRRDECGGGGGGA